MTTKNTTQEKDTSSDYEKAVASLQKAADKVRKLGADVRVNVNPKSV